MCIYICECLSTGMRYGKTVKNKLKRTEFAVLSYDLRFSIKSSHKGFKKIDGSEVRALDSKINLLCSLKRNRCKEFTFEIYVIKEYVEDI